MGHVMINQLNARSGARSNEEVPYRDLRYLFGEIMYGGHIVVRSRSNQLLRYTCVHSHTDIVCTHARTHALTRARTHTHTLTHRTSSTDVPTSQRRDANYL